MTEKESKESNVLLFNVARAMTYRVCEELKINADPVYDDSDSGDDYCFNATDEDGLHKIFIRL
jgi:hypothetical protein